MEDKIASQNDKIASQADTIHIMQEKLNGEPVVAFRVGCAKNFPYGSDTFHKENPVIWRNIEYNIGSAYDASNGKFTCPHDGIYSFYATSPIKGQHWGDISIYVNGSRMVYHYLNNHGAGEYEYKHSSP